MPQVIFRTPMSCPAERLWQFHANPGAFQRLAPPWQKMIIKSWQGGIRDGGKLIFQLVAGPLRLTWEALHENYVEGQQFTDRQLRGPFASWVHTHRCVPAACHDDQCTLEDDITYRLPGFGLGQLLGGLKVRRDLQNMFAFRHRRTLSDIRRHDEVAALRAGTRTPLRVAITGSTGMIGRSLAALLVNGGHEVVRVIRPSTRPHEDGLPCSTVIWDASDQMQAAALEGFDAIVHLSGENVAGQRWTQAVKDRIANSRVRSTTLLAQTIANLERKPRVFICASGTHYYATGERTWDEHGQPDDSWLSRLVQRWEAATTPARDAGVRVVNARISAVLGASGGMLAKMKASFALGFGATIGSGDQSLSWIGLDDCVSAIYRAIPDERLIGPVNLVAGIATNRELTATLARVLRRRAWIPAPASMIRAALGEMAEVALTSNKVGAAALRRVGFRFECPTLEDTLRYELGRLVW